VNIAFFQPSKSDSASRTTNATGHKARPAGDIKEGEMQHDSSRSVHIFHLSQSNNYTITTMPAQSCVLPIKGYSGLDLVPFVSEYHLDTICYILENFLLTMGLHYCHLHCSSKSENLYALNFQLATGLWFTLKNISSTIHLTANPLLNPFGDLPSTVNPELLKHIGMPFLAVLSIEKYTQNLLIVMCNREELHQLFAIAQKVGLDGARWIQMAKEKCAEIKEDSGWDWSENSNDLTYSVKSPKTVNCDYIKSVVDLEVPDLSKAVVLHPTLSTYTQEHPDFDPLTLPSEDEFF
jgi:hypothetical protein